VMRLEKLRVAGRVRRYASLPHRAAIGAARSVLRWARRNGKSVQGALGVSMLGLGVWLWRGDAGLGLAVAGALVVLDYAIDGDHGAWRRRGE